MIGYESKNRLGYLGAPGQGAAVTSGITTVGLSSGVAAGVAAGVLPALAIPIAGPIIAGIGLAISALGIGGGCGQTCVASTNIVNQVEAQIMKPNLVAFQSGQET